MPNKASEEDVMMQGLVTVPLPASFNVCLRIASKWPPMGLGVPDHAKGMDFMNMDWEQVKTSADYSVV